MTELIQLIEKIIENYGQTTAIILIFVIVLLYLGYLIVKNFPSLVENFIKKHFDKKNQAHVEAAQHRKNVTPKIRSELSEVAKEVNADRALLFEYSNGSSNLIGLPFLYTSATCEVVTAGTSPVSYQYQKINTALIAEFLEKLEDKGYFYIKNLEEIQQTHPVLYNFMHPNNVNSALFYTVYGVNDTIGFVVVTTIGENSFTREDALPKVAGVAQIISSLLNFDTLHEKL